MNNDPHRAGTAATLSFVFSGLGQLYNGRIVKGLLIILVTVLCLLGTVAGAVAIGAWILFQLPAAVLWSGVGIFFVSICVVCAVGIYSIVDAYKQK